ncbi:MAG TPA: hypothetical protein VF721_14375 [Pyrinomonadaceae bacterium]|jgi:hypothetical protein
MLTVEIVPELMANLAELREMARILGQDCVEHRTAIQNNDSQFHRRAFVRSVFAFIEGILYRMKETARHFGEAAATLSIGELVALSQVSFEVNDKGEILSKTVYPKFLNNFKFVFTAYSKSFGSSFNIDYGRSGWLNLTAAVKVRDRLMHPKTTSDLEVTDKEVESTKKVFEWFLMSYFLASLYTQKAIQQKANSSAENVADLNKKIAETEKELAQKGF